MPLPSVKRDGDGDIANGYSVKKEWCVGEVVGLTERYPGKVGGRRVGSAQVDSI